MVTYAWRAMGMIFAAHLDSDSSLARWFTCLAYAVIAGFIGRMILVPEGVLADVSVVDKVVAILFGFAVYVIKGRSIYWGTSAAFFSFLCLAITRILA